MTIKEAIKYGKEQLHIFGKCDHADFIKCSIDTMRKYQKIESKIKVLQHFTEDTPLATQRMIRIVNEIREVIEDGSN